MRGGAPRLRCEVMERGARDHLHFEDSATARVGRSRVVHEELSFADAAVVAAGHGLAVAAADVVGASLAGQARGSGSASGTLDVDSLRAAVESVEPRRNLTGSEEALLVIVATEFNEILTTQYGVTAMHAAPFVVIVYLVLRSALRCLDRPFV